MKTSEYVSWGGAVACALLGIPVKVIITLVIVNGLVFITKILTDTKKSSCKEKESDVKE